MDPEEILAMADERFERRLTEESAAIRQDIAALRADMATREETSAIRETMATRHDIAALRQELGAIQQTMTTMATRQEVNAFRQEMSAGFTRLQTELANTRVEMMKWSFMFWTGQCLAILGFLFVFLRNR